MIETLGLPVMRTTASSDVEGLVLVVTGGLGARKADAGTTERKRRRTDFILRLIYGMK
jgi:hypothetical protein